MPWLPAAVIPGMRPQIVSVSGENDDLNGCAKSMAGSA
jgi:hypothetical protein